MTFSSIFQTAATQTTSLSVGSVLIATIMSLVLGAVIAGVYMFRNQYTKNFVIALILLPAVVQVVIMMVNGNLGTAVAIAGAFSLIRFRSAPGSAKDITCVFLAMAVGLATAFGYITFAIAFTLIICAALLLLNLLPIGNKKATDPAKKVIKVTIPENLDYNTIFDDLFAVHLESHELTKVKTTNMGSMYELTYEVTFKDPATEKKLIDDMRCRNGNLPIVSSVMQSANLKEDIL